MRLIFILKIEFLIIDGNLGVGIRLEGNSPFEKINNYNYSILLIFSCLTSFPLGQVGYYL